MTKPWRDLEERLEFENEAERPLRESGEGESEGFEQSEAELIRQAEDTFSGRNPKYDAGKPEAEADPATYGEADDIHSSEEPGSDWD
jgi:hypothetical protein